MRWKEKSEEKKKKTCVIERERENEVASVEINILKDKRKHL